LKSCKIMILNPVLWVYIYIYIYIYIYNAVTAPQSQKPSILASLSQSLSNVPNFKQTITAICNLPMFHFQPFLFFFFHHKVKNFVVLVRDGLKKIKIEQNKRSYEFWIYQLFSFSSNFMVFLINKTSTFTT
jgi:hypothetical protein